ncbi:hypothetical protein [Shewanella baltica]|uniref:hypothetical protein n=1 Tax=Shewanella baltica TaxID=62322 RepID=UPI00217E8BE9|nr:hypothetical protein [Shewanella baltica]MCS6239159.1 hypothetical protein [Shewanella baltica]
MIRFKYDLNQDVVELQASNWSGLERVFVNGQMVSHKLNFKPQSEHTIQLKDGAPCKLELLIDPQTDELMCRIYKQHTLVASLKQGKENLLASRRYLQHSVIAVSLLCVFALYLN